MEDEEKAEEKLKMLGDAMAQHKVGEHGAYMLAGTASVLGAFRAIGLAIGPVGRWFARIGLFFAPLAFWWPQIKAWLLRVLGG